MNVKEIFEIIEDEDDRVKLLGYIPQEFQPSVMRRGRMTGSKEPFTFTIHVQHEDLGELAKLLKEKPEGTTHEIVCFDEPDSVKLMLEKDLLV